jgi:uncharacterized protein YkwD
MLVRLLVVASLLFAFVATAAGSVSQQVSTMKPLERGVLADINAVRRAHGLGALRLSPNLTAAARQHSVEMAEDGYFSHTSANGAPFDRRIAHFYPFGGGRYWSVGENLLWSSPDVDAQGALQMWLDSPEHRANLLSTQWRQIGIAAVHASAAPGTYGGRAVTIVTTDFGVRR